MKQSRFPSGWDEVRVKRVLTHYESQSEDEAVTEDEAVYQAARPSLRGREFLCKPLSITSKRATPWTISSRTFRAFRGSMPSRCWSLPSPRFFLRLSLHSTSKRQQGCVFFSTVACRNVWLMN